MGAVLSSRRKESEDSSKENLLTTHDGAAVDISTLSSNSLPGRSESTTVVIESVAEEFASSPISSDEGFSFPSIQAVHLFLQNSYHRSSSIHHPHKSRTGIKAAVKLSHYIPKQFPVVYLYSKGNGIEEEEETIGRITEEYCLDWTDIQKFFSKWKDQESTASIVLKDSAILLNLFGTKCIVSRDKLLVFDPKEGDTRKLLDFVTEELNDGTNSVDLVKSSEDVKSDLERKESGEFHEEDNFVSFELVVLTSILGFIVVHMIDEVEALSNGASECFSTSPTNRNVHKAEKMACIKQTSIKLQKKSKGVGRILDEIMLHENGLSRFTRTMNPCCKDTLEEKEKVNSDWCCSSTENLTEEQDPKFPLNEAKDRRKQRSQKLVKIKKGLELCKLSGQSFESECERILDLVREHEESSNASMSEQLYKSSRCQLIVSGVSLAAAPSAVIAGIFGMNLEFDLEQNPWFFYVVFMFIVSLFILILCIFFACVRENKMRHPQNPCMDSDFHFVSK